jgi:polysaccharide transporter, PST family
MQQLADVLAKAGSRKAAVNFGWLFAERAGRFAIGAFVGLLVARYLGPERLGSLSYCIAVVTLFGFVPALGLDGVVKRELLNSPENEADLIASSFALRASAGAIGCAIVYVVAEFGAGHAAAETALLAALALLMLQPALFLPELWLQVHLRAKSAAAAQLVVLTFSSLLRIWIIVKSGPLIAFAWVLVAEMALTAGGLFIVARRAGLRVPIKAARIATMARLLREAWPLMFASLAIVVYMKIDEVMLRHLAGPAAVGIYSAAARLSEVWYFFPTALASSVLPALLRARKKNLAEYDLRQQQYYDLSAATAYILSVPIAFFAPALMRLTFGPQFAEAAPILAVHIWSSVFVFLGAARGQWLVNEGLQKFYLAATCVGAISNVGLNFLFIPRWGGLGAAWATVASYALSAWLASYIHPAARPTAIMQTRALLIPVYGWRYLRRR